MMKKSLLAFATIALTTGAWGETVQHLGVTYTLTSASGTYTNPQTSTDNRVLNTDGATSGSLTFSGILYQDSTATVEQGVNATSLYLATPTFEAWSETNESTVNKRQNGTWTPGENMYISYMQRFINSGELLVSYNNVPTQSTKVNEIWLTTSTTEEDWIEIEESQLPEGITFSDFEYDEDEHLYLYETVDEEQYAAEDEDTFFKWGTINTIEYKNIGKKKAEIATKYAGIGSYKDLYFYQVGKRFYAIEKVSIDETTIVNTTTTTNYTPTTIPSGLNWSSVTSFTIGASINEIDEDAFATTEANKITIININANNTVFAYANNILSDYNKQNIIFVTSGVNNSTVELDESYISVAKWATYSCKNVTFYWTGDSFTKGENQGDNVTFEQLGGEIKFTDTADGGKKVQANTIFSNKQQVKAAIAAIISTTKYVDLRGAIYNFSSTLYWESNNGNKIIIVDETSPIRGINVVYLSGNKFVCNEFQLSDNYKQNSFYNPITFTAALAIYDRVIGEDYSSICLPFNVRYVVGNPRFMVGTLDNYDADNNIFTFTNVKNDLSANTPYFIYATNGPASFNNLTDVTVEATPATPNNVSINGATLCGTFSRVELSGNDYDNAFYGFSNGALAYIGANKTGYANTFRAYLKTPKGNLKPNSGASTIRFINESETAIENVKENKNVDNEAIYNLNGQRVSGMNANGIYVKNGKKIIVK